MNEAGTCAEPNRLDNQNLARIFEREWGRVQAHRCLIPHHQTGIIASQM